MFLSGYEQIDFSGVELSDTETVIKGIYKKLRRNKPVIVCGLLFNYEVYNNFIDKIIDNSGNVLLRNEKFTITVTDDDEVTIEAIPEPTGESDLIVLDLGNAVVSTSPATYTGDGFTGDDLKTKTLAMKNYKIGASGDIIGLTILQPNPTSYDQSSGAFMFSASKADNNYYIIDGVNKTVKIFD